MAFNFVLNFNAPNFSPERGDLALIEAVGAWDFERKSSISMVLDGFVDYYNNNLALHSVTDLSGSSAAIQAVIDAFPVPEDRRQELLDITGAGTTDPYAIHDNVSGEIAAVTEKLTPVGTDELLIEDSADANNKKSIKIDNLPNNGASAEMARVAGSTFSTVQEMQDIFHSSGWTSGGVITDNLDGSIDVSAGTGLIRAANDPLGVLYWADWPSNNGIILAADDVTYLHVYWNSGSPVIQSSLSDTPNHNEYISLGKVFRNGGVDLHINEKIRYVVGDHVGLMIQRMLEINDFVRTSGAIIAETGTLNISVTAGAFWAGLTRFTTAAFDSSVAGTFTYMYRDGVGGWSKINTQTDIDNLQYDDNSGTLATLANSRYGVHWVFMGMDDNVHVLYGQGSYTIANAEEAPLPGSLPDEITTNSTLVGKIIIGKSDTTFTEVLSAFSTVLSVGQITDHLSLTNIGTNTHAQIDTFITDHTPYVPRGTTVADLGDITLASSYWSKGSGGSGDFQGPLAAKYRLELGISANSYASVRLNPLVSLLPLWDRSPVFNNVAVTFQIGTPTANTYSVWYIIGGNTSPSTPPVPDLTSQYVGYRMDVVSGTPTLYAVNCGGTAETATDVTGSLDLETGIQIGFIMDSGNNIEFSINGSIGATHTTNLPTGARSSEWLYNYIINRETGDGTVDMRTDFSIGSLSYNLK